MNSSCVRFVPIRLWLKSHEITYDCIPEFEGSMRLMSILISSNYPIGLYSYEQGFGKTTLMKRLLANLPHIRIVSTGESSSLLHDEIFKYNLPIFTHGKINRGTKFLIWMEDVKYEDMELIRSWIDEFSSTKQQDLNFVLTGEKYYSYPARFTRHFVPILIHQSISTLISSIYSISIKDWLEEFSVDAISHPIELAHACLLTLEEIFEFLRQSLNKYQWNLHHVESVVNGMLLLDGKIKRGGVGNHRELTKINAKLNKKKQQDEQVATIVRLLCHELSRTILDRLIEKKGIYICSS
jgi:GTPase SAR1 family protein